MESSSYLRPKLSKMKHTISVGECHFTDERIIEFKKLFLKPEEDRTEKSNEIILAACILIAQNAFKDARKLLCKVGFNSKTSRGFIKYELKQQKENSYLIRSYTQRISNIFYRGHNV